MNLAHRPNLLIKRMPYVFIKWLVGWAGCIQEVCSCMIVHVPTFSKSDGTYEKYKMAYNWKHEEFTEKTQLRKLKCTFCQRNWTKLTSHAHYMRLNTYVFKYIIWLNSGSHHFIKKRVGPHAGPHHFINARFLVNPFSVVVLDRLMLHHFIDEIPLGTSFYKQRTLSDHFINTFGL